MKKTVTISAALILGIVGVTFVVAQKLHDVAGPISNNADKTSAAASWSDYRVLVGLNHVVFVGKVIRIVGNDNYPSSKYLSRQFEIEVIHNIKGNLQGTVILAQLLGGVESPAQVGSTYLFAARYSNVTGWYTFGVQEAFQLLTNDVNVSDAGLKTLAENDSKVVAVQNAYPHEQLRSPDVKDHIDYNSYVSRHYDANGQLIDDTVVLHEQYMAAHPATSTEPSASPVSSDIPVSGSDASVSPSDASAGDMASPMPSDVPAAS